MDRETRGNPEEFTITVFGAGISGLTAAHELAERGFNVQVIDKDFNELIHPQTLDRGIGGMARSQFACALEDPMNDPSKVSCLESSKDLPCDDVLVFDPGNTASLTSPDAKATLDRWAELLKARPDITLGARMPTPKESPLTADARFKAASHELVVTRKIPAERFIQLASPVTDVPKAAGRWLLPVLNASTFPAEHGFRFFPAFYRHLFDTMRRTRIYEERAFERGLTVYDNLVPSEGLGLARNKNKRAFEIPRRPIESFEELRNILGLVLTELNYDVADLELFQLKLFKYLTSSSARRKAEYENLSWAQFVEIERYSKVARKHIDSSAQMTAALRGKYTDARTQGNTTVQLLLDQFKRNTPTDFKLNGPTSGAWFNHWHDYLEKQGVTFARGTLTGFTGTNGAITPKVEGATPAGNYFILALSLPAMVELAPKFIAAAADAGIPLGDDNDFERILEFAVPKAPGAKGSVAQALEADLKRAVPQGALQHLSGIQYYFDCDIKFWAGHTQYLDSQWGLTSIAQPQFWATPRTGNNPYRGILSVDIGTWDGKFHYNSKEVEPWKATVDEIADLSWRQIFDHHDDEVRARFGNDAGIREPIAFSLDQNLELDADGRVVGDKTPFLVNRVGAFPKRPGSVIDTSDTPPDQWPQSKTKSVYQVHARNRHDRKSGDPGSGYVLAGTFLQTFTRVTSMEAANESARHAVNALLNVLQIDCERCQIWDPEDNELPDLQWFKDLDQTLLAKKLPHFVDILEWRELPSHLSSTAMRTLVSLSTRFT